jgi:chromosomal replication initiator protein
LEPGAPPRRTSAAAKRSGAGLRHYLLGPENTLLSQSIGLRTRPPEGNGDGDAAEQLELNFAVVPLTVCGAVGLGKSQLLHALAATWTRQVGADRVLFCTAADFARAYATATKLDDVPRFQQRYRRGELLLIDDLEALKQKSGAQQQLATILEHRQHHDRPTVLTASQPLHLLGLTPRLNSRLASGLVVPLQSPSTATRRVILQCLCQQHQLQLVPDAEQLLSENATVSVPQLMSLFNQLRLTNQLDGEFRQETTIAEVKQLLQAAPSNLAGAQQIIRATARYLGLPAQKLTGRSRRKTDVLARSLAMYLIRELTGNSFQRIGKEFGGRDHTTVMHACGKVSEQLQAGSTVRNMLQEIRNRLGQAPVSG